MGEKVELTVEQRSIVGKKVSKLRSEGLVPGVVYGEGHKAQAVMAPLVDAQKAWLSAGRRQPIELTLGKSKHLAMIKSIDLDPVKHKIRHLSFHIVNKNETVDAEVPVKIKLNQGNDETPAERAGLVVLMTLEKVQVKALPSELPEAVYFDGEKLESEGQHATIADLILPKGVKVDAEPDQVIASVYEPGALAAKNEEAAGSAQTQTGEEPEEAEAAPENTATEKADKKE